MAHGFGNEPLAYVRFGEIKWPISLLSIAGVSLLILKQTFPLETSVRVTGL